jgi:hypothetical protein
MSAVKESINEKLEALPEFDLHQVLAFVQFLEWKKTEQENVPELSSLANTASDPLIGLFAGPPDLASKSEDILQAGIVDRSGWTWKDNP